MNAVVIEGDEPLHPDTSFDACELIATSPSGASGLRATILNLAVKGRLVPQNSNDEPADKLMERLFSRGPVRRTPTAAPEVYTAQTEAPYELPCGWLWAKLGDLIEGMGSGWSPACDDGPRVDTDRWAVLRTTAVQAMQFVPTEHKALPMRLAPRSDIEVKPGDVLVTRAGPVNRVGISCAIDETPHRLMLSDKIVRFRLRG
jgi:type I restriction enzyme S subunit